MIPPERGFKGDAASQQNSAESLSTMQKVVRYAEKDDLLLYMTAAFGIFMPAVMYFFYRHVHNKYKQIKKARKKEKRPAPGEGRKTTIFYCSDSTASKQIAYELADGLQKFDPIVSKLGARELEKARNPRALHIFIICISDFPSERFTEFIDWLDELRYEHRKKNYLKETKFILLSLEEEHPITEVGCNEETGEVVISLEKRLRSLESIPLDIIKSPRSEQKVAMRKILEGVGARLEELVRRFYYGEFDPNESDLHDESAEDTGAEESD